MKTYKYTGDEEKHFPSLGVTLKPGEEFTTETKVNHPELEEKAVSKSEAKRVAAQKEDK